MNHAISTATRVLSRMPIMFWFLLFCITPAGFSGLTNAQTYTINEMGRQCTAKIGKIEPFSCLDGEIIPITVNNTPLAPGHFTSECDRPSFLSPAYCNPYSRVGRLTGLDKDGNLDSDVQNVFICRRYNNVTDPNDPEFKDVAIVQHRKSTGETCFFQHLGSYTNSTRVPPPAEPASSTPPGKPTADLFWESPASAAAIGCNRCHDMGPFIHSPYVDQVKTANGAETIVFPLPDTAMGEHTNYRFLGDPFVSRWGIPNSISPLGNRCVSCHVFGTGQSSSSYTRYSTGLARPVDITDLYAKYPDSHWMPPDQAREMDEARWNQFYEQDVEAILACNRSHALQPSQADCNTQPFGPNN